MQQERWTDAWRILEYQRIEIGEFTVQYNTSLSENFFETFNLPIPPSHALIQT
jgi:hypothetical protein